MKPEVDSRRPSPQGLFCNRVRKRERERGTRSFLLVEMACHSRGDIGGSVMSEGPMPSKMNSSSDSISEWRSREQLEASPPSTSPAYWDTDEEDDLNSSSMTGR